MKIQKNITKEKFYVVGLKIETSNQTAQQDIGGLWQRFFADGVPHRIANKVDEKIYAVYTVYHGDYTQPYEYILGCAVKNMDDVPEGMSSTTIDAQTYDVFSVHGRIPDVVVAVWQEIWQPEIDAARSYQTDYEVYDFSHENPSRAQVDVHIGVV